MYCSGMDCGRQDGPSDDAMCIDDVVDGHVENSVLWDETEAVLCISVKDETVIITIQELLGVEYIVCITQTPLGNFCHEEKVAHVMCQHQDWFHYEDRLRRHKGYAIRLSSRRRDFFVRLCHGE